MYTSSETHDHYTALRVSCDITRGSWQGVVSSEEQLTTSEQGDSETQLDSTAVSRCTEWVVSIRISYIVLRYLNTFRFS